MIYLQCVQIVQRLSVMAQNMILQKELNQKVQYFIIIKVISIQIIQMVQDIVLV